MGFGFTHLSCQLHHLSLILTTFVTQLAHHYINVHTCVLVSKSSTLDGIVWLTACYSLHYHALHHSVAEKHVTLNKTSLSASSHIPLAAFHSWTLRR